MMRSFLMKLILYVKAAFLWLIVPDNRKMGFKNTTRAIEILKYISKLTETSKDDRLVEYIAKNFDRLTKHLDSHGASYVSDAVTESNDESVLGLSIDITDGFGVRASLGGLSYSHNPADKSFRFGAHL